MRLGTPQTLTTAIMKLPIPEAHRGHSCHWLGLVNCRCSQIQTVGPQEAVTNCPWCLLAGRYNCSFSKQITSQEGFIVCFLSFALPPSLLPFFLPLSLPPFLLPSSSLFPLSSLQPSLWRKVFVIHLCRD